MGLEIALFTGHSPLLLKDGGHPESQRALSRLSEQFTDMDAVIVVSSHWISREGFLANTSTHPLLIQDYYGFPEEFYKISYPCQGDPQISEAIIKSAHEMGVDAKPTLDWGIDHGHWTPLLWLLPDASVPVIPLSISADKASGHILWGQAIRRAADRDARKIGFIASGALTHRLDKITWGRNEPFPEGEKFDMEILRTMLTGTWTVLDNFNEELFRIASPEGGWGPIATLRGVVGETATGNLLSYERMFTGAAMATVHFDVNTATLSAKTEDSYAYSTIVGRT